MNHHLFRFVGSDVLSMGLSAETIPFFLMDTAAKCFLLLLGIWLVASLLRTWSAAALHRLWTLGFCGCLAIPVITLFLPTWSIAVFPASWLGESPGPSIATTNAEVHGGSLEPVSWAIAEGAGAPVIPNPISALPTTHESKPAATDHGTVSINSQPPSKLVDATPSMPSGRAPVKEASFQLSWAAACLVIWVGGIVLCLLRTVWHQLSLARVLRRSCVLEDKEWSQAVVDASRSLEFTRKVELRKLDGAESPMVSGILRTIVLLPSNANSWDSARRRVVLLHELAHAKRYDVLTQVIAGLVCALHWFNPICWVGLLQMRKLRELACDDLVVSCGARATDYASVLLDVAKSYQHRNLRAAIGMSRGSSFEHRILALLDKARSHVSLTRRAAFTLLMAATAIVAMLGSLRLQSQEVPPAKEVGEASGQAGESDKPKPEGADSRAEKSAKESKADDDIRTMEIRVRDEQGKPIEGTKVHASVWDLASRNGKRRFTPNADYLTDAEGIAAIKIPRKLRILRLWPSKSGYVPQFVNFTQGTHDDGKLIPGRYEFKLAKGTELGGKVVDDSGKPIAGVGVAVRVEAKEPRWGANPKPIISTWLTDEDDAITDKNGKWKIVNAPAPVGGEDHQFYLKFTHEDYISDSKWGELQLEQKLTTPMLRDGSATLTLSRGVRIVGKVVSPGGRAVPKGLVIWHDDPYGSSQVHEAQIGNKGQFETIPLPPGEHPLTVVAPGFSPQRRMVNVAKSMDELVFSMQRGKRLTLKIVDRSGNPIPNAYVGVREWRGAKSLYNSRHSSVLNSRIPRQSDENGVYLWNWAPDDAVTYQVSARDFSSNTVTLIATEAEHVVKLSRALIASGKVTNAKTGKPVMEFRVVPVIVFRPEFLTTTFDDQMPGKDGRYEIELTDDGERDYRYQVRIDADGYRSAISEQTFGLGDGHVTQDFSLEPAAARQGTVVDRQGKPVASAKVVQATPSILPAMRNAALEWGGRRLETSANGRFQLPATFEPIRLRVIHASGFADVSRKPDEPIGTIQLQPWAKVSGKLLQDGRPIPNETVYFFPVLNGRLGDPRFQDSFTAPTDENGQFEFDRLPPIAGAVRALLGPWQESPLTSSQAVPLDLKPGEKKAITLGGTGVAVTGRVAASGRSNSKLNKNWSLNYLIRRDGGIELSERFPQLSFDPAGPVQTSWFLDPSSSGWLGTRQNHFVKLAPDGRFHISGVPPGKYDLVLRLFEQPTGCLVETIGERVVPIEVTAADAASGSKDVDVIEVECRSGPRVGQNMGPYKFVDTSGREQSIKDLRGRHVVLHVWASWCGPCLKRMPEIKATIQSLSDQPITFVGLNIDKDVSRAKAAAKRGSWNWSQNYLGDDSDMGRQLAISSLPTYFLVGPDGLLLASTANWTDMKDKIEAALKE